MKLIYFKYVANLDALCVKVKCHYRNVYLTSIWDVTAIKKQAETSYAANFCINYASGLQFFICFVVCLKRNMRRTRLQYRCPVIGHHLVVLRQVFSLAFANRRATRTRSCDGSRSLSAWRRLRSATQHVPHRSTLLER